MRRWLFALVALLLFALPARGAERPVRVGLCRVAPPVALTLSAEGAWRLSGAGKSLLLSANEPISLRADGSRLVVRLGVHRALVATVLRGESEAPWGLTTAGHTRRYAGALTIRVLHGRLLPVLTLPLEDYLRRVVADELPPDWPEAAAEAQAIAARSYALAHRDRHGGEGYDFCDSTHCALFRGLAADRPAVDHAVDATAGEVLLWHGEPVDALWHAVCGGRTDDNALVFGGAPRPYLRGVSDRAPNGADWCAAAPWHAPWRISLPRERLARALRRAGVLRDDEPLRNLQVTETAPGGLAVRVCVTGDGPHRMSGYALWMALGPSLGWGDVASPHFAVACAGDHFVFTGHGLGHGVGLCQWGARGRALAGWSAARILAAYFPGTMLARR